MTTRRPSAPKPVRWIARTLEEAGYRTWAVGGAVRDVLLGLPSGDWDLTTAAPPEEVQRLFRRTVPIGIEHGTVGVLADGGVLFEVTTFRRDVETDGRHAVVAFADTVEEDLARRDFTINAIAWHPLEEELLDPFGGVEDLESGILRTVGDPARRFAEDWLRVLRALRFAGRFDLRVADATWRALRDAVHELPALSAERIRDELVKVLEADPRPSRALELYEDSGALSVLYPELQALVGVEVSGGQDDAWRASLKTTDALPVGRHRLRLAALLRDVEEADAAALLVRLRLSNALTDEIARLAAAPPLPDGEDASDADVRRWLSRIGPERLAAVARLELARARATAPEESGAADAVVASWRRAREIRRAGPPLEVADLALDGRDLIRMGLKPGPRFGEILDALLERVLEDPDLNRPETLKAEARRIAGTVEEAGDG